MNYINDLQIRASICTACPAAEKRRQPIVGSGKFGSPIMVVTDMPNSTDDKKGKLLQGRRGKALEKMLRLGLLRVENLYFTSIVKCYPARLPPIVKEKIAPSVCRAFLNEQIRVGKPKAVIIVGETALRWTLIEGSEKRVDKFQDWVGNIYTRFDLYQNIKFLVVENPLELKGRAATQCEATCSQSIHRLREYVVSCLDGTEVTPLPSTPIKPLIKKTFIEQDMFRV